MEYGYVHGDLLEHPQNYQYSRYEGEGFLKAWQQQRSRLREGLSGGKKPVEFLRSLEPQHLNVQTQAMSTLTRLAELLEELEEGTAQRLTMHQILAPWVKTFEVRKRLFGAYDGYMRPLDAQDYRNAAAYLLFACVMEAAWSRFQELPHLNVWMKVMDSMSSFATQLTEDEQGLLAWLIEREQKHISGLSSRLGVLP